MREVAGNKHRGTDADLGLPPEVRALIRRQMNCILSSPPFSRSLQLSLFLRFIVEAWLKEDTGSLKESVLGQEAYGRGRDFDPRVDPIVRTEARRLRGKLAEYYQTRGLHDPVVIDVPKGSYVPVFRYRTGGDLSKLSGEVIGTYRVVEALGKGPGSVTYRVQEPSTQREFALKLLENHTFSMRDVLGTLEADVAAATLVRHENVCSVHRLEHSDEYVFVVADYIEGQSLDDRLAENKLGWEEAMDLSRQMLCGLAAAHRLGVVHGNLKPSNILLAGNGKGEKPLLKIVDFGMRSCAGLTYLNPDGTAQGTTAYLTPAQPELQPADVRKDVWSAGAVMYELFAGAPPSKSEVTAPQQWRKEVPEEFRPALGSLLKRCLAADRDRRYVDAVELHAAFVEFEAKCHPGVGAAVEEPRRIRFLPGTIAYISRHRLFAGALQCVLMVATILVAWGLWGPGRTPGRDLIRRLAVLPAECPSWDQECRILGHALTNSLINRLSAIGQFEVVRVAPSSQKVSLSEAGTSLHVDHVITASFGRSGTAWQLNSRMIRVRDQAVVSTGQFRCSWRNIQSVESKLLDGILAHTKGGLANTKRFSRTVPSGMPNVATYELYGRASHSVEQSIALREQAHADLAEEQLKTILALNPGFNEARILLAKLYYNSSWGSHNRGALLEHSKLLLEEAIWREPGKSEANALLAVVLGELGEEDRALVLARRAVALGPLEETAHQAVGAVYAYKGFLESAVVENDQVLALDPANLSALAFNIHCLFRLARWVEAETALREVRRWHPGPIADGFTAEWQLRKGNYLAARNIIFRWLETGNPNIVERFEIADGLHAALTGRIAHARRMLEKQRESPPRFFDTYILLAAQVGETQRAIEFIGRSPLHFNYRYLVSEPRLAPLRRDASFPALVKEAYARWQADLSRYGPSLPALPPKLPSPKEFLARR